MKSTQLAALILWSLSLMAARAQDSVPTQAEAAELVAAPLPSQGTANGARPLTRSDVEAFSDGLLPAALAEGDIAGAVIVVVKDGQVLFEKGYGVSDVATQAPIDPERTLFRPGSVSKLFVWTAVMQLVGEGKLDLDRDINAYLDFHIPATFDRPITMRDLMTHTAGFEETFRPLMLGNPNQVEALDRLVKEALPERIFPPSEVPAYSNYGAALAGYIVQRVSGEGFADYVQRHIFAPLGMTHATFVQPLPPKLRRDMSKGYNVASGAATPFEMIAMTPAGGLSASGADLARFMIAHLNGGAYRGIRILSPELTVRMHRAASRPFPYLPPMAFGFYHEDRNGHLIVAHDGDTGAFHSMLDLVLDANTGLFLSVNSSGRDRASGRLRSAYLKGFLNRYFPAPPAIKTPTLTSGLADGRRIAGDYVVSRRADSNFTRFIYLLQPQSIDVNPDGTISVSLLQDPAGHVKRWREVKPFLWQEVNGERFVEVTFRDGRVAQVGSDDIGPIIVLQPAGAAASRINLWLLVATVAMLALVVLSWPIKAILRWRYRRPFELRGRDRLLYRLSRVVALLDLVFLVGFPLAFIFLTTRLASSGPEIDWLFRALQLVGLVGVVGTIAPVAQFAVAVRDGARPWWTKASDLLLVLAAGATVWFAFSQHLLTLNLKY